LYDRRDNRHEDDVSGGEGGVVGETIFVEEHDFEEKTPVATFENTKVYQEGRFSLPQ
jgi:hypothetical protein